MNQPTFSDRSRDEVIRAAQAGYSIACEWGEGAARNLSAKFDLTVIIDVLSFSTCVDVAVGRNIDVYPADPRDSDIEGFAKVVGAYLARKRGQSELSLSPSSLANLPHGARLVLPSANGASITALVDSNAVACASLRNYKAVAEWAKSFGGSVLVLPAGERWINDYSLRPALEDALCAGLFLQEFESRSLSPEAQFMARQFSGFDSREAVERLLLDCTTGRELSALGYADDVQWASRLNESRAVPLLQRSSLASGDQAMYHYANAGDSAPS